MEDTNLLSMLKKLEAKITALEGDLKGCDKSKSDKLDKLLPALCSMQGGLLSVSPNRKNNYFKSNYSDLDGIMESIRPLLEGNGLSVVQEETNLNNERYLRTILYHNSGQFISGIAKLIKNNPRDPKNPEKENKLQSYGTSLSYHKRYSLCSLLGITIPKDPLDNDGEHLRKEIPKLSDDEIIFINESLEGHDDILKHIMKTLKNDNISSIEDCPKYQFDLLITSIDTLKKIKKESGNKVLI